MSINALTAIPSLFQCRNCIMEYSQRNRPIVLSCGDTFCEKCVKGLKKCPTDRKVIVSTAVNKDLLRALDKMSTQAVVDVSQMKYDRSLQRFITWKEGFPKSTTAQGLKGEIDELKRIISHPDTLPALRTHSQYVLAMLTWANLLLGDSILCSTRELFFAVTESEHATPRDLAHAYFGYAYLELHKKDFDSSNYARVRDYFARVEQDPHAMAQHRLMARFYLACFSLRGLGGLSKSHEVSKAGFQSIVYRHELPSHENAFARLILAEFHILDNEFAPAIELLSTINIMLDVSESEKIYAKACYWKGIIWSKGVPSLVIKSKSEANDWFRFALTHLGEDPTGSFFDMKQRLEDIFRLGDKYPRCADIYRGPHYEKYLDLHLDEFGLLPSAL